MPAPSAAQLSYNSSESSHRVHGHAIWKTEARRLCSMKPLSAILIGIVLSLQGFAADATHWNEKAPYGAADFMPSVDRPIGFRGDGSGHYPGATPPTTWTRNEKGEKKNILWETKLPCYSWATPVVVGD